MDLAGKVVLVTGGTGFIGSRLVEKLVVEQRAHVRVLVRNFARAARIARFPVEMIRGDLTDRQSIKCAVAGCAVVFHCAYDFSGTRDEQKRTGLEATGGLAEAVLTNHVPRMVHVSSFSVYDPMSDSELTESSHWPASRNWYVRMKRASERMLQKMHQREGLPVVVLQPSLVYGPYSPHWTMDIVTKLKTGIVPLVDDGNGYCNAVFIDDVADALILAATQPECIGKTFLISGEQPVTWKQFYGAYEEALGIRSTVPMTVEELSERRKKQRKESSLPYRLKNAARIPEVFSLLAGLPMVPTALRTTRLLLSDDRWATLKARVTQNGMQNHSSNGTAAKPIHIPDEALLSLYQSKTRVCIDKAKEQLGYSPKFDFERGMEVTAQFIRWANI
jgi:nucleoside-diphosphate-sugar epimerase